MELEPNIQALQDGHRVDCVVDVLFHWTRVFSFDHKDSQGHDPHRCQTHQGTIVHIVWNEQVASRQPNCG